MRACGHCGRAIEARQDEVAPCCPDCIALRNRAMEEYVKLRDRAKRWQMHPCGARRIPWPEATSIAEMIAHIRDCPHPGCQAEWRPYHDAHVAYCGEEVFP